MMTLPTTKPATKAVAAALLLILVLAHHAAAQSTLPATSSSKGKHNNKGKGGSSTPSTLNGLAACEKATAVPGCSACVLASSSSKHKSTTKKYTCTLCEGEGYETTPVKGVCSCGLGFGRVEAAPATTPAHGKKGSSGKGKTNPAPPLAPCSPCPEGTVSGSFSDSCLACAPGLEPLGKASCVAKCTPITSCAAAGASCGPVEDGCGGELQCGSCPGSQVCDLTTRSCLCPDGATPVSGGLCPLAGARLACIADAECASGLCADGACLDSCPPNSEPAGSGSVGGCVCSADSFSLNGDGKPPCAPCGGESSAPSTGSNQCTCLAPREWSATLNECACTTPGTAFVNGECRKVGDSGGTTTAEAACSFNDECASGVCSQGVCSLASCAPGTVPSGTTGKCLCGPGTWSESGETPCLPCGSGASSASYGSSFCTCTTPQGSVWSAAAGGSCECPDGSIVFGSKCLLKTGEDCAQSEDCATQICGIADGKCLAQCPPNSTFDPATRRCRCNSDFYGAATGGDAPCAPCLGDATTNGLTGQTSCSCPSSKGAFSIATGGCICGPNEQKQPGTGKCLAGDLRLCERNDQCAGGLCDATVGVCKESVQGEVCPPNSEPVPGGAPGACRCLAGFYDDGAAGCKECGPGSYAPLAGASSCQCSLPAGSVWVRSSNTCRCLEGEEPSADGKECLVAVGGSCSSGEDCASSLCSSGVCVTSCPTGSQAENGSCVCSPSFFGVDGGTPPCVACAGGSKNLGTGNTACRCSPALGEIWNADINRCECPKNQEFAAGRCRGVDGQACRSRDQCVSATCIQGLCQSPCTPPRVFGGSGACVCPRGAFGAACTPCGPGSTTESSDASECLCESPIGSVWTGPTTNTCSCGADKTAINGECKLATGEQCSSGYACASGLCNQGTCVASCPLPGSEPDGVGGCRCKASYYGAQGQTPCTACGAGASSSPGSSTCSCPSPATWTAAGLGCQCPSGFNWSGSSCTCLATTCSPLCPGAASPSCPQGFACERGQCLPTSGSKCVSNDGYCGLCVKSCGNTLATVCSAYGLPTSNKLCGISAVGGGGRCAGTDVCCSVNYPYYILPSADGSCPTSA